MPENSWDINEKDSSLEGSQGQNSNCRRNGPLAFLSVQKEADELVIQDIESLPEVVFEANDRRATEHTMENNELCHPLGPSQVDIRPVSENRNHWSVVSKSNKDVGRRSISENSVDKSNGERSGECHLRRRGGWKDDSLTSQEDKKLEKIIGRDRSASLPSTDLSVRMD